MKKAITLVLVALLVLAWGCSSTKLSDEAYSIGLQALTVTDKFLDMEISGKVASDKIDELLGQLGDIDDATSLEYKLETRLIALSGNTFLENYADINNNRNELAKMLGKKER